MVFRVVGYQFVHVGHILGKFQKGIEIVGIGHVCITGLVIVAGVLLGNQHLLLDLFDGCLKIVDLPAGSLYGLLKMKLFFTGRLIDRFHLCSPSYDFSVSY